MKASVQIVNKQTGKIRVINADAPVPLEYMLLKGSGRNNFNSESYQKMSISAKERCKRCMSNLSYDKRGENNPMWGKSHSVESRRKIGQKNAEHMIGRHWYTNGNVSTLCLECPYGYWPGRH
jgi:uncharacterized protein with PIN domain